MVTSTEASPEDTKPRRTLGSGWDLTSLEHSGTELDGGRGRVWRTRICSCSQPYILIGETCMVSSGTGSLVSVHNVTHDGSNRRNSEGHANILSASLRKDATNLIGSSIMQQDERNTRSQVDFRPGPKRLQFTCQSGDLYPPNSWERLGNASRMKNASVWWCQWITC